ncbi:sigma-70 family RNA polymerase sigma factor [Ruminococcaceae bacterium OttesenSCG-928-D13]|nr:sigma-70 family RNA polymerase sigma factor [Ruminococcaceae bacterium OttesenSCG-928-D13]
MKEAVPTAQIEAARQGSEADLASIIARYMPFIRRTARRHTGPGLDFDDAVQEGLIGLFSAIETWQPGGRAGFSTYAGVCIQNAILSARKAAGRKKHRPLNTSVPIPDGQSIPGPEEAAIASEQVNLTMEKAKAVLSPMEKTVLLLYLDGFSYRQIAQAIGKPEKSVENALGRVRRKLR